jgi:hypothetical protein
MKLLEEEKHRWITNYHHLSRERKSEFPETQVNNIESSLPGSLNINPYCEMDK